MPHLAVPPSPQTLPPRMPRPPLLPSICQPNGSSPEDLHKNPTRLASRMRPKSGARRANRPNRETREIAANARIWLSQRYSRFLHRKNGSKHANTQPAARAVESCIWSKHMQRNLNTSNLKICRRNLSPAVRARFATLVLSMLHSVAISEGALARGDAPSNTAPGTARTALGRHYFQRVPDRHLSLALGPSATFHLHVAHARSICAGK